MYSLLGQRVAETWEQDERLLDYLEDKISDTEKKK